MSAGMDKSSPGWREKLGAAAVFADESPDLPPPDRSWLREEGEEEKVDPKSRGEYERRRGWRVDKDTLERFREIVSKFQGTQ